MSGVVLICLVLLFTGCSCQVFSFSGGVRYAPYCGRWSVTGTVTLTPAEMRRFGSKVTVQTTTGNWGVNRVHTTTRVCVVDLIRYPSNSTLLAGDTCHVISRSGNVYTIGVSRLMQASEAGLTLEAVVQSQSGVSRTFVTTTIGHLPDMSAVSTFRETEMTYQIDDGEVKKIGSDETVTVTVCRNMFVPVKFCARNPPEGSMLKIYANGQETTSQNSCVETGQRFNFSDTDHKEILFEYEDSICFRSNRIIMSVSESDVCDVNTPEEITLTNACFKRPGSKAREIVTLSTGNDVMCDTESAGGNWIVFQRRNSSDVDFYLGWNNYTQGFGDLSGNFWLGLDRIHSFCDNLATCELRVDIGFGGKNYHATYQDFYLDGPLDNFRLHVGKYCGNAGDALTTRGNGMMFSTKDKDNDVHSSHCAQVYTGAWWYDRCHKANLNGVWGSKAYGMGLNWYPTTGLYDSATFSEMKLRIFP